MKKERNMGLNNSPTELNNSFALFITTYEELIMLLEKLHSNKR